MASLESRSTGHTVALHALSSVIVRVPFPPGKATPTGCHLIIACSSKRRQGAPAGSGAQPFDASGAAKGACNCAACAVLIRRTKMLGAATIAWYSLQAPI